MTLRHAPVDEYSPARHGRLLSVSRPVAGISPQQFLQTATGQERFFWRDGRRDTAFAGVGVAAHLMGYGQSRFVAIQRQADALFARAVLAEDQPGLAAPRLFGGFSFREEFTPDVTWTGFHPAHFILPHYQLMSRGAPDGGESWLTINALLPVEEDPAANLPLLREALDARFQQWQTDAPLTAETAPAHSDGLALDYPLSFAEWAGMIRRAQEAFAQTPLQKVVLARICEMRRAGQHSAPDSPPLDIHGALTRLLARYPDCYGFLFEPQPGHAFLGATPELLVRVEGERLETMGLAGSIQRGQSPAEDAALADALLTSAKDRHEHGLVVDALARRLRPLTSRLEIPQTPQVLALSNIQHLYTPVQGELRRPAGVLPLVQELHPTPALGGSPRELALAFIQEQEPTLRGWYAAPVGWIDSRLDGAFAVAIRSAVVQKQRAWAYAGGGIVADSIAEKEWEETEWKFRPMLEALGNG